MIAVFASAKGPLGLAVCAIAWAGLTLQASPAPGPGTPNPAISPIVAIERYCLDCHDGTAKKGDLNLERIKGDDITRHPDVWEKVIRRLRTRQMPPPGKERPDESAYVSFVSGLAGALDDAAAQRPNPGRPDSLRRLNRTEYQNAVRDLLDLQIDATALLPKDEASHGFDNVTVANLSPTLLDRYISAAQKISRLAVGSARSEGGDTIRLRPDLTQEEHVPGLPIGTRGGALLPYTFAQDAEYEIQVRLARDRNEEVEGLREAHELEVLLDRALVASFTVKPPVGRQDHEAVDQHLKIRIPVRAGPHQLGLTFVKNSSSLLETKRQPYHAHYNTHRHPRLTPAIYQISINGPYHAQGAGDTPSRRRIFIANPTHPNEEESCARQILAALMRRAYRRPVTDAEVDKLMGFYREGRTEHGFDGGIESGLSAILVSPHFLFRVETDPPELPPETPYRISNLELATRLSFFLWSSIPDEALLQAAIQGDLAQPDRLTAQVRRMLADPRSRMLVSNFAGQWLYLRNLESITPDLRLFPDFDDNLRQSFRRETERFVESLWRADRPVLELLKADYTFLDERLAKHYGIPHIYGSRFRRVSLADADSNAAPGFVKRGGLLRQGSILTVTSYADRTSPVIRGHWILGNLIGTAPPPPPADVPALKENTVSSVRSVRERLAEHRANAACASCHNLMDPVGFALENFDAVGRWRTMEEGQPVDSSGGLPDGTTFSSVDGLEEGLLNRPEIFVTTLTEKLLTFAIGRGVEHYDAPAIRKIVQQARASDYRFSSVIIGIAQSVPFTMRRSQ